MCDHTRRSRRMLMSRCREGCALIARSLGAYNTGSKGVPSARPRVPPPLHQPYESRYRTDRRILPRTTGRSLAVRRSPCRERTPTTDTRRYRYAVSPASKRQGLHFARGRGTGRHPGGPLRKPEHIADLNAFVGRTPVTGFQPMINHRRHSRLISRWMLTGEARATQSCVRAAPRPALAMRPTPWLGGR